MPKPVWVSVRAYLISHLGKYVPGKAMVVVMRVGLTSPYGARPATAALATFYETIAMMAAGAAVAAVGFAAGPRPVQVVPLGLSVGLAVALLVVVEPRVFPRVSKLLTLPFPNVGPGRARRRLSYRLLGEGLALVGGGLGVFALSQVAVVSAPRARRGCAPGLCAGRW